MHQVISFQMMAEICQQIFLMMWIQIISQLMIQVVFLHLMMNQLMRQMVLRCILIRQQVNSKIPQEILSKMTLARHIIRMPQQVILLTVTAMRSRYIVMGLYPVRAVRQLPEQHSVQPVLSQRSKQMSIRNVLATRSPMRIVLLRIIIRISIGAERPAIIQSGQLILVIIHLILQQKASKRTETALIHCQMVILSILYLSEMKRQNQVLSQNPVITCQCLML